MGEELNTGAENPAAENPAAAQWKNMDVRAQAQEQTPAETPSKPADKETAQEWWVRAKYGESQSSEAPEEGKEDKSPDVNLAEAREERRSRAEDERRDLNHEQTESEKRLETYEKRLEEIEKQLEEAESDKAGLEEILIGIDDMLEKNSKQHESLSSKADELERKLKQCKRGFFSKISRLFKDAIGGRLLADSKSDYAKRQEDLEAALQKNKEEQEIAETFSTTREQLDKNEAEGEELDEERASTVDQIQSVDKKINRLNSEKAKLGKQAEELKEMTYNEGFEEAIADATGGKGVKGAIRRENRTIRDHERSINRIEDEKASINEYYDEGIEEAKADVMKGMKTLEMLGYPQAERTHSEELPEEIKNLLDRAEQSRTERLDRKDTEIDEEEKGINAALDRINLIEGLRGTENIKGALLRLKSKIMKRIRGF